MKLRPIEPADAEAVTRLVRELGYDGTPEEVAARLRALAEPADLLLLAEVDGAVVGWIHVQMRRALTGPPFAEIEGLVVAASARRGGVGRELVSAAQDWARARGLAKLRVR